MFEPQVQRPYIEAFYLLYHANIDEMRRLLRTGVNVRLVTSQPWDPRQDPHGQETVQVTEHHYRLPVADILNRFIGVNENVFRLADRVNSVLRGYDRYYYRPTLCNEHLQAYHFMQRINPRELERFLYTGIPVRDPLHRPAPWSSTRPQPAFSGPEEGQTLISPLEVFRAMQELRVPVEDPELRLFESHVLERIDRTARETWMGTSSNVRPAAIRFEDLQRSYNEAQAMYQDSVRIRNYNWFEPEEDSKRRRQVQAAQKKALKLLERVVSAEDFDSYQKKRFIETFGKRFKYHIKAAGQTSIYDKNNGSTLFSSCLQLAGDETYGAPQEDRVVMEYLMIKNDEERYLKTANLTPYDQTRYRMWGESMMGVDRASGPDWTGIVGSF